MPRPIEFNDVAGRISIGTVVAIEGGELLAIPDISPYFGASQCPSATTVALQKVGDHLQLTGQAQPRRRYHHHGYYGYGYGGCYAQEGRHDVFVDVVTGMIELEIKHRSEQLGVVAVQGAGLQVTLTGCNDTLVLTWTE